MSLGLTGGGRNPIQTSLGHQGDVPTRKAPVDTLGLSQVSLYFSLFLILSFLACLSLCAGFRVSQ